MPALFEITLDSIHELGEGLVPEIVPHQRLISIRFEILAIRMTRAWITLMILTHQ